MNSEEIIQTLVGRINAKPEPTAKWGGSIIWSFIDTDEAFLMTFAMDGKVKDIEKASLSALKLKKPNATINTSVDTMDMLLAGVLQAAAALGGGSIKVEGSFESVFKLAAALGPQ
jgi:hypothetical protein